MSKSQVLQYSFISVLQQLPGIWSYFQKSKVCNEPSYESRNLVIIMFLEPWTLKYSKMKLTEKKLRQKSFFFLVAQKFCKKNKHLTKQIIKDILTAAGIMQFTLHLYFMVKYYPIYLFSTNRAVSCQQQFSLPLITYHLLIYLVITATFLKSNKHSKQDLDLLFFLYTILTLILILTRMIINQKEQTDHFGVTISNKLQLIKRIREFLTKR